MQILTLEWIKLISFVCIFPGWFIVKHWNGSMDHPHIRCISFPVELFIFACSGYSLHLSVAFPWGERWKHEGITGWGKYSNICKKKELRTGRKCINKEEMQCWHFLLLLSMTRAHYITTKDQGQHFLLFFTQPAPLQQLPWVATIAPMQQKSAHTTDTTEQKLQNSRCNSIMQLW